MTKGQWNLERGTNVNLANKRLCCIIRQKNEKVINFYKVKRAGAPSLTESGQKKNANPFLIKHSTFMLNLMKLLQVELCAHYVNTNT